MLKILIGHVKLCVILFVLTSCGNVTIKNQEWCGDLGSLGAECFSTNTDDERSLNKPEWDALRVGWVCSSADNFGDVKKAILKLCEKCRCCSFDTKSQVVKFDDDLNKFLELKSGYLLDDG